MSGNAGGGAAGGSSGGAGGGTGGAGPTTAAGGAPTKAGPVEVVGADGKSLGEFGQDGKAVAPNVSLSADKSADEKLQRGVESGKAIARNNESLIGAPRDSLDANRAHDMVRADVASLARIEDKNERHFAAGAMGDNAVHQAAYRAELQKQSPEASLEAITAYAENERRSTRKEDRKQQAMLSDLAEEAKAPSSQRLTADELRKAAEYTAMDNEKKLAAQSWAPGEATARATSDLAEFRASKTVTEQHATAYDMNLAARNNRAYRETLEANAPDVAKEVDRLNVKVLATQLKAELESGERVVGEPTRRVFEAQAKRYESTEREAANDGVAPRGKAANDELRKDTLTIDTATQERLAALRARDSSQVATALGLNAIEPSVERAQQKLDDEAESKRASWLKKGQEAQAEQPRLVQARTSGGNQVESDEVFTATKTEMKAIMPPEVEQKYVRVGDKYYHPENKEVAAFEDKGNKLETRSNSEQVAETMVSIARARGWDEIKVSGSETFRKEAWLEAAAHGMHVKGYTPSEQDKAELAKRGHTPEANKVEKGGDEFRARENVSSTPNTEPTKSGSALSGTPAAEKAASPAAAAEPQISGTLVKHGAAPYQHDKDNNPSYYATVRDNKGAESTTWGIDLERAIKASNAKVGDQVTLNNEGRKEVVVEVPVRDKQGKVVGTEEKATHRNEWSVELARTFAQKDAAEGVRQHPELAGTYAALAAIEKKAEADNLSPQQRAVVTARVRQNIVNSIERGEIPNLKVREETEVHLKRTDEKEMVR